MRLGSRACPPAPLHPPTHTLSGWWWHSGGLAGPHSLQFFEATSCPCPLISPARQSRGSRPLPPNGGQRTPPYLREWGECNMRVCLPPSVATPRFQEAAPLLKSLPQLTGVSLIKSNPSAFSLLIPRCPSAPPQAGPLHPLHPVHPLNLTVACVETLRNRLLLQEVLLDLQEL